MSLKQRLKNLEKQQVTTEGTASFWDYALGDASEDELTTEGRELLKRFIQLKRSGRSNVLGRPSR